jgi:putative endonuclease
MNRGKDQRKLTGKQGEDHAAQYLTQHGYLIIERNWRCRIGELDLIVLKDNQLVIIEVRSRKSLYQYGHPVESVEWRKQSQVRRTAEVYLTINAHTRSTIRFDVITVLLSQDGSLREIVHIPNAF